ncbi:hypothetical protein V2J09_018491 [Rumex salicifolius]
MHGQLKDLRVMEMEMENRTKQLRLYFNSGKTKETSWRRSQLMGLLAFVEEKEEAIFKALNQDLGKHPAESYRDEIGVVIKEINAALQNLECWMSSKKIKLPIYAFPSRAVLAPQPLGLVLILSSWNLPIGLSLQPLLAAIAAGNTVVLKPSELAPAVSSLLADELSSYLDSNAVHVIQGGPDVATCLLQLKWDHIFFTGSKRVGSIVMTSAAKHLTPITLELGGKCAAILDSFDKLSNRERTMALKRLLSAKFGTCSGQVCLAVDYILVEEHYAPKLVELLKEMTKTTYGESPDELASTMARIVNNHRFLRLKSLLDETGVQDSILENIEASIDFINARPKPLALYCFSKDDKLKKRFSFETLSGSLVFNDTVIQYAVETIPFGGVGESGFGRYHGKFGFDTFSQEKAIVYRNYLIDFWFRHPPWEGYQLELFRSFYTYDYLNIVLTVLGLKKPPPLPLV